MNIFERGIRDSMLSERMTQMLLNMYKKPYCPCYMYSYFLKTAHALEKRGLVEFLNPGFRLTEQGKFQAEIILRA
jgi:hypothetical protein